MENITLAVLNITSYFGQCSDATHVYGKLILCTKPEVTIDTVEEWHVKFLGENVEVRQPLTLAIAKKLDEKDNGKTYQRHFRYMSEDGEGYPEEYRTVNKFDTFDEVEQFAINKWKELKLDCPFISLYEGEKYDFKDISNGEMCKTKILYQNEK